jgi:Flp pilus assembly protein TadG
MKRGFKQRGAGEKGQSAIEFIVVVVVLLFFLLFFLSFSILLVVSDYVEYATFMAARTYKSMYSTQAVQERNARTVFQSYTRNIQGLARNLNLEFVDGGQRGDQAAGVKATYTLDMFYLPPLFVPTGFPGSAVTLSTETRLGRDPANEDCSNYFTRFVGRFGLGIDPRYVNLMDDNGC